MVPMKPREAAKPTQAVVNAFTDHHNQEARPSC